MVQVKIAIGIIQYTEKELEKEIEDLQFLKDAFLVLLNPKVTEGSDLPFNKAQVIEHAREIYNWGYSQEFINRVFNNLNN